MPDAAVPGQHGAYRDAHLRSQELDKIVGLKAGADDYLTKPFSFMELLARVEAVLRRSQRFAAQAHTHEFGQVTLNFRTREATRSGASLPLLPREFRLLEYFVEHRGEVISRDQLLDSVWGHDGDFPVDPHRRHARRQAAPEDRGRSVGPRAGW